MGAKKVPSLHGVRKCADRIKNLVGNPTTKYESAAGNIFYLNDVGKSVGKVGLSLFDQAIFILNRPS